MDRVDSGDGAACLPPWSRHPGAVRRVAGPVSLTLTPPPAHSSSPFTAGTREVRGTALFYRRKILGAEITKVCTLAAPWNVDNSGPARELCVTESQSPWQ